MKQTNNNIILPALMLTMLTVLPMVSSAQNAYLKANVDAKVNTQGFINNNTSVKTQFDSNVQKNEVNGNATSSAAMNKNNNKVNTKVDTFIGTVSTVGSSGFSITNKNNPSLVYKISTNSQTSFYSGTTTSYLGDVKVGQNVIILGEMSTTTANSVVATLVNIKVDNLENRDINNNLLVSATSTSTVNVNTGFFHKILNWFRRIF